MQANTKAVISMTKAKKATDATLSMSNERSELRSNMEIQKMPGTYGAAILPRKERSHSLPEMQNSLDVSHFLVLELQQ